MYCKQLRFRGREFLDQHREFGYRFLSSQHELFHGRENARIVAKHCTNVSDAVYEATGNEHLATTALFHVFKEFHMFAEAYTQFYEGEGKKWTRGISPAAQLVNQLVFSDIRQLYSLDERPGIAASPEAYMLILRDLPTAVLVRMYDIADIVSFSEVDRRAISRALNLTHGETVIGPDASAARRIYRPIASRLGSESLQKALMQVELEGEHNELYRRVQKFFADRSHTLSSLLDGLTDVLRQVAPDTEIIGSVKGAESSAIKLVDETERFKKQDPLELSDIIRFYVLVDHESDATYFAEKIFRYFKGKKPFEVNEPEKSVKKSGNPGIPDYESTYVRLLSKEGAARGVNVEIQVRTRTMHRLCIDGYWNHETYKGGLLPTDFLNRLSAYKDVFRLAQSGDISVFRPICVSVIFHDESGFATDPVSIPLPTGSTVADVIGNSSGFYTPIRILDESLNTRTRLRFEEEVLDGDTFHLFIGGEKTGVIWQELCERLLPKVSTYATAIQLLDIINNGNYADLKAGEHKRKRNNPGI